MKRIFHFTKVILIIGIAIILFFSDKAIRQWRGPAELTKISEDNLDDVFVEAKVNAAYGLLYRETLYEGKYAQYYLISLEGIEGFVTLDVPFKEMLKIATMLAAVLITPEQQPTGKQVNLKGVIHVASESQSQSYNGYVIEQNLKAIVEDSTVNFFFQPTEYPYGATGGYVFWTKLGIVMVTAVVITYVMGIFGIYQIFVRGYLRKKSKEELQLIEEEFHKAKRFSGDIRIGSKYTFLHIGPVTVILENQDIISVYSQNTKFEFRKSIYKQELILQTSDHKKYKTTMKGAGVILTYYKEQFPEIQVDEWDDKRYSSFS